MVGKLMKHELRAIFRVLMWFMIAAALLSVLARVIFALHADERAGGAGGAILTLATVSVLSFWYLSMIALLFAGTLLCLVRYFKSLFTGEGYMTFSLPVTPTKLLIAKFLSAFIVTCVCTAEIVLCVFIALPWGGMMGNLLEFLADSIAGLWGHYFNEPLYIAEMVLIIIVSLPASLVYLFLVASIGQLFSKHRVGLTLLLYFGSSFALSMAYSILLVPLLMLTDLLSPHFLIWLAIVLIAGFDVGGFFLIRYILSRKVNLVV